MDFQQDNIVMKDLRNSSDISYKADPISDLKAIIAKDKISDFKGLPVMAAGWYGYFGYDMVKYHDNIDIQTHGDVIPDGYFIRPEIIIILDNKLSKIQISLPIWVKDYKFSGLYQQKLKLLDQVTSLLVFQVEASINDQANLVDYNFSATPDRETYKEIVAKCQDYIRAGEVFQIVPSRRFESDYNHDPAAFYRSLREINPSPFLFYFGFDDFVITGSSPEIMVRIEGDDVIIRPLAGTRKRADKQADLEIAQELLSDPKEIAEHLMLLDLGRNDVGRVVKPSTVKVLRKMEIEFYSHVMHISSTVSGKLKPDFSALDALLAGFPAGTVTGAPKIRAMEILSSLEKFKRGFYSGCIGYFSANSENMDMAITLRTALIKANKIYIQSGAGVVYDSNPEAECQETEKKAAALFEAANNLLNIYSLKIGSGGGT